MARKNEPYIYKVLRRETPNPRQQAFFRAEAANIAYGGARGGGKSWAMRRKLVLLAMRYPGLKLLLLRRTLPELRANHILPLQRELEGYAAWSSTERAFRFPNGSRLVMGYCDSDSDCAQYQGQEYEVIGFEEATNFEPDWLTFIATCLRTTRTDFAPRIYYTCNPGGPGHAYIKRLFIDRAFHDGEDPADYVFIPAKVYDNQVLMQRDPGYLKRLEALPPARRRAHLEGDWNVYEGQVFAEWRDDPAHYADGKWTHVIEPFDIPNTWRVYRSFDFGYAKPFSVGWWAESNGEPIKVGDKLIGEVRGDLVRFAEWYGWTGRRNEGVKMLARDIALGILDREEDMGLKGRVVPGPADSAIWGEENGMSIERDMRMAGVYWEKADKGPGSRVQGWQALRERLAHAVPLRAGEPREQPGLFIARRCVQFQETLPVLPRSQRNPDDIDTEAEDHIADEVRYRLARRDLTIKRKVL